MAWDQSLTTEPEGPPSSLVQLRAAATRATLVTHDPERKWIRLTLLRPPDLAQALDVALQFRLDGLVM